MNKILLSLVILSSALCLLPELVSAQTGSSTTDIAVLYAKVDLLQSINDRTLNTVYWTLGILAAIFLGLISVNLYFNITANKREIEKIKDDLLSSTKNEIASSEVKIIEKIQNKNENELKSMKSELSSITENEVITSESRIFEKTSALISKEVQKASTNSQNVLKNSQLTYEAKVTKQIESIEKKSIATNMTAEKTLKGISAIEIRLKELEAFKYSQQGKMGAIIKQIELLEYDIENREWNLVYRLPEIKDELKNCILNVEQSGKLKLLLSKIKKEEYMPIISEIQKLIIEE